MQEKKLKKSENSTRRNPEGKRIVTGTITGTVTGIVRRTGTATGTGTVTVTGTGTIISDNLVLTCAHLVYSKEKGTKAKLDKMTITFDGYKKIGVENYRFPG